MYLQILERLESFNDAPCRLVLFECKLGMGVNLMAKRRQFRRDRGDLFGEVAHADVA